MTSPDARTLTKVKVGLVILVVAGLVAAYSFGVFERLKEPADVARVLRELGPWGYVVFVLAYAVLQPFGVPGTVFVVGASLVWPWPIAFALSMIGTMAASVVGFSFARFVARDWIARFIPPRFKKYDEALEKRGFATVLVLRLIFWMPPTLHAAFGISRVSFSTHFWASFAAYVPILLLVSYFGPQLLEVARRVPVHAWIGLGATLVIGLAIWLLRRRGERGEKAEPESS